MSTREPQSPRPITRALTPILAIAAIVILALVAWRALGRAPETNPRPIASESPTAVQHARGVFTDVAADLGLDFTHVCGADGRFRLPEEMGPGGAFFDYDNDNDLDIYLVQGGPLTGTDDSDRNRLFRNDGHTFTDVSAGSGADITGYGLGCAAADYDHDGHIDLYVTRLGPNVLLKNNGDGTFTDVTANAGVDDPAFGAGAAFFDYDRDGWLDLYVANYVDWSPQIERACFDPAGRRDYCNPMDYDRPSVDRLYRNLGNGAFADVTEQSGIAAARGNGLGVLCCDFDGDGWIDIYVANDQTPAFLWHNNGNGSFQETAALKGCAFNGDGIAIAGMGVDAQDLDNDADFDLVITNIHDQPHLCLRNDGGMFEDVTHALGFAGWGVPYTAFGVALFDQDNDGRLDCLIANGAVNRLVEPRRTGHEYAEPNQFIRRDATGRFYDASAELGDADNPIEMSRAVITGDYDNDGDIDLLVTNNRGPARLLRNDAPPDNAWTSLELRLKTGRHAHNARAVLHAEGQTHVREVRTHAGYLGSNDPRIHVGLADATQIDKLQIIWPDGTREHWDNLSVRQHLRLTQGKSPAVTKISADTLPSRARVAGPRSVPTQSWVDSSHQSPRKHPRLLSSRATQQRPTTP